MAAKNHEENSRNEANTIPIIAAAAVIAVLIIATAAVIIAGIAEGNRGYAGMHSQGAGSPDSQGMMDNRMMGGTQGMIGRTDDFGSSGMMNNGNAAINGMGMMNRMMMNGMMGMGGMMGSGNGMMGNVNPKQAKEMHEGCEKMMGADDGE